jgi:glycosyltransferase involved in cell wall biosynthesis
MACGVPVVSSDVGGLPELNIDGETGFVVPVGDVQALAERTLELLKDRPLYLRTSKAAHNRATVEFAKERIVPQYEAAYERVLNGKPRKAKTKAGSKIKKLTAA